MSTQPAMTTASDLVDTLIDALRQADAPQTAAQLRKGLTVPKPPAAAKLGAILEEQVAAGTVARFDPLTGKTPRYWTPGRDEHEGVIAGTLEILRQAAAPMTAADLLKALPEPKVKPPRFAQLLEAQVAAGTLARFDPAKGNSPRYWTPGRDEHEGVVEKLMAALREPAGPKTAAEIIRYALPGAPKPLAGKAGQLLEEHVAAGTLHRFAATSAKGAARYSDRSPEHHARRAMLAALGGGEPKTFAQLHKALKGAAADEASQRLQELIDAGEIHKALKFDDKKPDQFSTQPPDLVGHIQADFAAIYKRFDKAGVSRDRVDEAARAYLGVDPAAAAPAPTPAPAPVAAAPRPAPGRGELAQDVIAVFEELRRERFGHTGLVPIPDVRRGIAARLGPEMAKHAVLDDQILALWRGGRLRLLPINDATRVSAEDMNDAIPGNNETWYYLESKS